MSKQRRTIWLLGLLLVLAGAGAYRNSFAGGFIFDDRESILENDTIRHLGHWRDILHPPAGGVTVSGRPGLNATFALNWAWSGAHPWSYHLVNLIGHLCAGLILFGLARRTLERVEACRSAAVPLGWAIALLWVVHPLQTESVTYIVQRAEMLMGLCYLGTMLAFLRFSEVQEQERTGAAVAWAALCVAVCAVGMTCKEVMVSAPVILLLYDRTFLSGSFAAAWRRRRWLWVGLFATWIILAQGVISTHSRGGTAGFGVGLKPWQYWWTQGPAIARYLWLAVWPHPLVLDYGFEKNWVEFPWTALPQNLFVAALALWVLILLAKSPRWGFLGFWFFAILAPTSVIPGNRQSLAEHRMYVALAPLLAAILVGAWLWIRNDRIRRRAALAAVLGLAAVLIATVRARNRDYGSDEQMWRLAIARAPHNAYAYTNLGASLYLENRMTEARAAFVRSTQLDPNYAAAESNLGMTYQAAGDPAEAIRHYRRALEIDPHYPQAANNLGVALAAQTKWDEAIAAYERALRIVRHYPDAEANLGIAYRALGRFAEAEEHLRRSLEMDPRRAATYYDLGLTLRSENRLPEAEAMYAQALRFMPTLGMAESNWGVALALEGKPSEALAHFTAGIASDPANPEIYMNRGLAFAALGRYEEAAADDRTAVRLRPAYVDAWANLGTALLALKRPQEAVNSLGEAVRIAPTNAQVHYDYSLALAGANSPAESLAEVQEALRLDPDLAEARNNLAVSLAGQGKIQEAFRQLAELLAKHPDFAPAHDNLGLLYRATGHPAEAEKEFARAAQLRAGGPRP